MEEGEVVSAALRSGTRTVDWNLMLIHGSYGAFSLLLKSFPLFFCIPLNEMFSLVLGVICGRVVYSLL